MDHVIIGLTTMRRRLSTLHLTLASLLQQDYPSFEVRVFISRQPFLLDEGVSELPEACRALDPSGRTLKWMWVNNVGPYRKLLPILAGRDADDSLIATADDDTRYPSDWLSKLVYFYQRHGGIIAYRGHRIRHEGNSLARYRKWMTGGIQENPSVLNLPTGKDGVLYHKRFFHPSVLDVGAALRICRTADDLWFKWHTIVYGVPVYLIETDYTVGTLEVVNDGPSLYWSYNQGGENDRAIAALEGYAARRFGVTVAEIHGERGNHIQLSQFRRHAAERESL